MQAVEKANRQERTDGQAQQRTSRQAIRAALVVRRDMARVESRYKRRYVDLQTRGCAGSG